jgi:hypothetical protein
MISFQVAVKCVRIEILDDGFKDVVYKVGRYVVEHPP